VATEAPVSTGTRPYTRRARGDLELPHEKPVIVPALGERDPSIHAWADARFWADIMSEHALFFALLVPEELAARGDRSGADREHHRSAARGSRPARSAEVHR
jgi:hypothetical protein